MQRQPVTQPTRLLNEQFMEWNRSFNIMLQRIDRPYPLHWHEFYELCLVMDGEATNVVNGTAHPMRRGSFFLLTPADFHEIIVEEGKVTPLYNMIFSEELLTGELRELLLYGNAARMTELDEETLKWVEQEYRLIDREMREPKTGQRLLVKGALERILIELLRRRETSGSSSPVKGAGAPVVSHAAVSAALMFMHHHFREPLSLKDAAREANLAPGYFSECFRLTTGTTFQQYLQNLRVEFAAALLLASVLPITEICYAAGFRTLTHFERVFKGKYGVSPRRYHQEGRTAEGLIDHKDVTEKYEWK